MLIENYHHILGPGDQMPPDNSVREAARERAVEILTDVVLDGFMQDMLRIGEARGCFTRDEDDAIDAAIRSGNAMKVGLLTMQAVRRVIRIEAEKEADRRVDRMERDDEADYAEQALA